MSEKELKREIERLESEAAVLKKEIERLRVSDSYSESNDQPKCVQSASIDLLKSIIEDMNGAMWAIDCDYRLIAANRDFREKYSRSLKRKLSVGDCVFTDDLKDDIHNSWKKWYNRAFKGEKFSIERKRDLSDPIIWGEYRFSPVYCRDGKIIGCSVLYSDITDRKDFENNLRKSNIDLNLAQRIANIGNWSYDPADGTTSWSDGMYRITGRDTALPPPFIDEFCDMLDPVSL